MKFKNQNQLFQYIWDTRPHVSELTGNTLLPKNHWQWHWQFLHVLPKGQYTYYKLNSENILLALPEEHANQNIYKVFRDKRDQLIQKYNQEFRTKKL